MTQTKRCLIVGAGGFGREVLNWAQQIRQADWSVAGFLDSNRGALDGKNVSLPILGSPEDWRPSEDEVFVAGLGDPKTRLTVCNGLTARGAHFITVIHPSVIRGNNVEIGDGSVIAPMAVITTNVVIGRLALVNVAASIGHDARIGDGVTVSCHCDVMGYATLGQGCFLGSHASILPGKRVGEYSIVGAGSSVMRHVPAHTTVVGIPAQVLIDPSS